MKRSPVRVLMLEDNPSDYELIKRELRDVGFEHEVEWAPDKASFLRSLDKAAPDLILLDYSLPGFSGLAAISMVRQRYPLVPTIVVSGAIGEEAAIEALKAGATDYVLKDRLSHLNPIIQRGMKEAARMAERRKLEEDISRQASLIDLSPDAIMVKDLDGTINLWSRGAENLYGWTREEAIGRSSQDLLDTTYPVAFDEVVGTIEREGRWSGELIHRAKDGRQVIVQSWWMARYDGDGKMAEVLESNVDITERKKVEEALLNAKNEWELTFHHIPDLIAILDDKHGIVRANKAMMQRLGLIGLDQSPGLKCYEFVHGTPCPPPFCPHSRTMADGKEHTAEVHEDKLGGDFLVSTTPIIDNRGKIVGSVHVARDITERKRMEEELKRSNAELQQYAYVASHDLQEPLRMVITYLNLLEKKYGDDLDDKAKQYMSMAVEGGQRARELVRDLLEYSRVGTRGKIMRSMNMEEACATVCEQLSVSIKEERATVTHDPLPVIMADDTQILNVLQNLVSNGIKFHGDEAPAVHISCEDHGDEWLFSVRDNGIGIDAAYKERVFVLFQRLHTREEYDGNGIGLAVAKKIVERHGGRIWFESEVGKGTTFYFTIPKSPGTAAK